jgi:hypothetical protein
MAATTCGDRLSDLGDATLIRILSHLPADEVVRSSALSRRWHHLHASVPVVDVADPNDGRYGWQWHRSGKLPMCFDQMVTCALLSRDPTAPIRCFRLDAFHPTRTLLHQWVAIALRSGAEELRLTLRTEEASPLRLCPSGHYKGSSADFNDGDLGRYVRTPRQLFHSATLRHMSLSRWTLQVPGGGDVPLPLMSSLQTLALHRIMGSGQSLQKLISSCTQLVDLTLEECPGVTTLTVTSACLRRLALVCCHNARGILVESRRLRSLRYKGGLPPTTRSFRIANHATIAALTIDICEAVDGKTPSEIAAVTGLIARCGNLEFLHLALRPAMAYYSSLLSTVLRGLPRLTHLELKGCLLSDHSLGSVSILLQNTPNLQVLSLFPTLPDPPEKKADYLFGFEDMRGDDDRDNDEKMSYGGPLHVPRGLWMAPIRCFKHRLTRISLVGYTGSHFERMIAKFLLSKALALEELSVSIAPRCSEHRAGIAKELASWRSNPRTRVTFL